MVYEQEAIFIGDAIYLRDKISGWEKVPQNQDKYTAIDKNQYEKSVVFNGAADVGGQKARHFILTTKWTSIGNNWHRDEDFWFDEKGRLLKYALEGNSGFENSFQKENKSYEYDMPQPKIEAPIK